MKSSHESESSTVGDSSFYTVFLNSHVDCGNMVVCLSTGRHLREDPSHTTSIVAKCPLVALSLDAGGDWRICLQSDTDGGQRQTTAGTTGQSERGRGVAVATYCTAEWPLISPDADLLHRVVRREPRSNKTQHVDERCEYCPICALCCSSRLAMSSRRRSSENTPCRLRVHQSRCGFLALYNAAIL